VGSAFIPPRFPQSTRQKTIYSFIVPLWIKSRKHACSRRKTATRVLAEIIASDVSLLVMFNHAIDGVIQNNPKARANPKALAQLDGYKRPLVSSLAGNLQRFGMERVAKVESLQEIIAEMSETGATVPP